MSFNLHSWFIHFSGKRLVELARLCLWLLHRNGRHVQHQFHLQSRSNLDRQVSVPFSKKKKKAKKKKEKGGEADPRSLSSKSIHNVLSIVPSHKYLAIRGEAKRDTRIGGTRSWTKRGSNRFTNVFSTSMESDGQRRGRNKRKFEALLRNKIQLPPVLHLFCTIAGKLRSRDCRESSENLEKGWSLI